MIAGRNFSLGFPGCRPARCMRPAAIVVANRLLENFFQVPRINRQQVVEEFTANSANHSFAERVLSERELVSAALGRPNSSATGPQR